MSWEVMVFAASVSPPAAADMPPDWQGDVLGTADDIRQKVSHCLPGTDWSDPQLGCFDGDEYSYEFDLADCGPIDNFPIYVRGGGDAVRPLLEMSQRLGWWLFDTWQVEWLHHCEDAEAGWVGFQSFRDRAFVDWVRSRQVEEPAPVHSVADAALPRELSDAARWHIVKANSQGPVFFSAIFWGLYLVEALFGINLLNYLRPGRANDAPDGFLFWLAVALSIGAPVWAAYYIRRALHLAHHGVEVTATIVSTGKVGYKGMVRVNYSYSCNGRHVTKAMSTLRDVAREYENGTRLLVLVCDPNRPKCSMERDSVLPELSPPG